MFIKDMFAKPIDRDIKGVIKVGQADDENIIQELEEYVVTRELQKHFADFFASYKKGINGHTDKMGVWISGFFGSGKSHFLKILSYLLENKEVNGKKAIDYFIDDKKIIDPMVLADMKLAASVPTDVVLFNIDSKSEMAGKQTKDAIVSVFLKVFNEMQGFCGSIPALADLERQLTEQSRYDEFKEKFEDEFGKPWIDSRNKFDFIQDTIVDVLEEMGFMSESAARNWCEKAIEPYQISIENFAKMVKEYLDHKGRNHHLVFLVDEIGQYIGDDSKLMLNLQTVTEDLGTACHGKVWIIVISQQDIDSITKTKGNDFSKIQGRFDTRLSLSSANVDEVIKKRILDKSTTAEQTLRLLYEQKSTIIKNLIVFNDGVEKKLYTNERDFALVYPFVPYQFNLLASVLTSIRTHGASGKHLSEGERSMIALFKESAMNLMDREHGALIPFNVFYDALHQFLDHSHKGVISRAADNNYINPDNEADNFNVNVLKTLFMIKCVKEITANVDNITSLMISDIDTDRIALKKRVEEALKILVCQMLVQKNGDNYVFLTDEEQEINREIENQNVEMAEVISKASEIIFEDIVSDKKYRYPEHNGRYNFAFNQFVDDRPYKSNQNHAIGVRILTPGSDYSEDETTLRMMSGQGMDVLVVLPNESAFLNELRSALKIEKYLRLTTANKLAKFEQIKEAKRIEMRERNGNAKLFLQESMKHAAIYVNGDRAQIGAKEVSSRINDALGRLVSTVYHKLSYIDVAMNEANIRALFKTSNQQSFALEGGKEANAHAIHDVLSFIATNSSMHTKTSMKSLMDRFMKAPYGFVEDDVEWLVAKLFKNGEIALTVNGAAVTLLNKSEEEIVRYITKKEYVEKLLTERRQQAGIEEKKAVREVMKELFGVSSINDDDDSMMQTFQSYSSSLETELEKFEIMFNNHSFPGKKTVLTGKGHLRAIIQIQSPSEFIKQIYSDCDDLLDFAEDFESVKAFYAGEQKKIFEDALKMMKIYDHEIYNPKTTLDKYCDVKRCIATGWDEGFIREWYEVNINSVSDLQIQEEKKWYFVANGGNSRRWYGNISSVINWENDGRDIRKFHLETGKSTLRNIGFMFKEGLTYTYTSMGSGVFNARKIYPSMASIGVGPVIVNIIDEEYIHGFVNSVVFRWLLNTTYGIVSTFETGNLSKISCIYQPESQIYSAVSRCVDLAKTDWDSFETSVDFIRHPFVNGFKTIAEAHVHWENSCNERFFQMRREEENLNRIFIDIYGLQNELSPDIEDKLIYLYDSVLEHDIRSFISYSVGCILGRYSLDVEGLVFAGGQWDSLKYNRFMPDIDNIIPITDEQYFQDDIVGRFVDFVKVVYGTETLEANLDFISNAIGEKGKSSREIIRNYFLKDFYKDHCQVYQRKPIYWLFDSGKKNGFKALIYMHRYDENTIGNLRIDYLHRMQRIYENEIARMQDAIENSKDAREVTAATKRKEKLIKQLQETKEYDEKIAHLALARTSIDLDDGVKVNYEKVQTDRDGKKLDVLAKI